jgi:FKBP-type peptidyl-prolyl cis-trans isomerase
MNSLKKTAFALLTVTVLLSGCKDDDPAFDQVAQYEKEIAAIDAYLETNSIAHIKDPSGVRIVPTSLGSKLPAHRDNTIDVTYNGKLFPSEEQFDEGVAKGFVDRFIPGWQIAMTKLPVGSNAVIYIPSYYGYGKDGNGPVPGNTTLVFDVTINAATRSTVFNEKLSSDTTAINTYVANKGLQVVNDPTGVKYISQVEGTGSNPSWFSQVKLKQSFILLTDDAKVLGTYEREPTDTFGSFVVDYTHGIQIVLQKMKPGGKMRVFIPSGLAFGINGASESGVTIVPPNSNIIVDLELIEVK